MEAELQRGTILADRYRLERELGRGGFGSVWKVTDTSGTLPGPLAIKVLSAEGGLSAHVRRRFSVEARLLLEIDHPNVVRAHDFIDDNGQLLLVMEHLNGHPLTGVLNRRSEQNRPFSPSELRQLFAQLVAGVAAAHARGAVHRDLKPANVMVMVDELRVSLKILDFGIAKVLAAESGDQTTVGRMVGSYLYMSPEQALGAQVDERADVFALGTLLFELATLRRAWARDVLGQPLPLHEPLKLDGENSLLRILERIVKGPRPKVSGLRDELRALDPVLEQAFVARPQQRTPGVRELGAAVDPLLAEAEDSTEPVWLDLGTELPSDTDIVELSIDDEALWDGLPSVDQQRALAERSVELRADLELAEMSADTALVIPLDEMEISASSPTPARLPHRLTPTSPLPPHATGSLHMAPDRRSQVRNLVFAFVLMGLGAAGGAWLQAQRETPAQVVTVASASTVEPSESPPPPPRATAIPAKPPGAARASTVTAPAPQSLKAAPTSARPRSSSRRGRSRTTPGWHARVVRLGKSDREAFEVLVAELQRAAGRVKDPRARRRVERLLFVADSTNEKKDLERAVDALMSVSREGDTK